VRLLLSTSMMDAKEEMVTVLSSLPSFLFLSLLFRLQSLCSVSPRKSSPRRSSSPRSSAALSWFHRSRAGRLCSVRSLRIVAERENGAKSFRPESSCPRVTRCGGRGRSSVRRQAGCLDSHRELWPRGADARRRPSSSPSPRLVGCKPGRRAAPPLRMATLERMSSESAARRHAR
jgi:hypothetical protein